MIGWNGRPITKKRLWRGHGFPREFDPGKLTARTMRPFACAIAGYDVRYHRPKRFKWFYEPESDIKYRETFIAIRSNEELVSYLEFVEFELDPLIDNEDLWEWLDAESAYYGELATALSVQWEDVAADVGAYGPIVLFDNVWVRPDHSRTGFWKLIVKAAMERLFANRSIAVFKPFPLEYEGLGEIAPQGFRRRLAALTRMTSRLSTVQPLPQIDGTELWYWSLRPGLEATIRSKKRDDSGRPWKLGSPAALYWADLRPSKPSNDG